MTKQHEFDFDQIIPRQGSGCFKWDSNPTPNTLPMFVADMDFAAPPAVLEALHQRVTHGVFGYTWIPDEYYDCLQRWCQRRYNWAIDVDWVLPAIGVVPAISAILRALIEPGDGVLVQTPVYHCFFSSIRNQGGRIVQNGLRLSEPENEGSIGRYEIDFDDLEQKAADPTVKVMLLCHPHNPSGRVWTDDELIRVGDICLRHGVTIVSDEIHCDLLFPGERHRPFADLKTEFRDSSITLSAPGKTFNLAGLQISNVIIANKPLRQRIARALHAHEIQGVNPFGVAGLMAAYDQGEDWLDALNAYLFNNYQHIKTRLAEQLPSLRLYPQQSTYLAWIDCSATGLTGDQIAKRLLDEGNLRISSGMGFLPEAGQENHFIRLNFGCPRSLLDDGLDRLVRTLKTLKS